MIKAVIFDLDGVFIHGPKFRHLFTEKYGVGTEDFAAAYQEVMPKARLSKEKTTYGFWKPYFEKWGLQITEEELFGIWFGAEFVDKELLKLARELKKTDVRVIFLSNNFPERIEHYSKSFLFLHEFPVYYSSHIGFRKPDTRAFQHVLDQYTLKPEEVIFFDDLEKNVKAAESIGIRSYLYNADKVLDQLAENGVSLK